MYSLLIHGRKSLELQKWHLLRGSVKLAQNVFSAFSSSFSSLTGLEGFKVTASEFVSMGFSEEAARTISMIYHTGADPAVNLLRRHGLTDSQIVAIEDSNPELYNADLRSLAAKLKFLQSRGVTSFELSEILQKSPENFDFNMKGMRTTRLYYHIIAADKSSKVENLAPSLPKSAKHKHENIMRNVWALRELGMPRKLLLSLVKSHNNLVFGKRRRFEETVKKVVGKGLDPTTPKFVQALKVIYRSSDQTTEEKVNLYRSLGFAVEDVWYIFKKFPRILALSEKNILNSTETFTGLGISRDEFTMMVKRHPSCLACSAESVKKKTEFLVKDMKWPLSGLHPKIFSYSMDERIVPRCKVVKALMSKGLIGSELPSVFSVLVCTNEGFLNRYVRNVDDKELVAELMAIFTARGEEDA